MPVDMITIFFLFVSDGKVTSLVELAAQAVACHIPFEVVEHFPSLLIIYMH
jgi:hypothetical protein